jgi:hypothetical protein
MFLSVDYTLILSFQPLEIALLTRNENEKHDRESYWENLVSRQNFYLNHFLYDNNNIIMKCTSRKIF